LSSKVAIAAVCMRVRYDTQANMNTYQRFIEEAGDRGVRLLAFPECSLQGYTWTWDPVNCRFMPNDEQLRYFQENAEVVPGRATKIIGEEAKRHNMYIQFGMAEKAGPKVYNSAVLVGPTGLVGVYRKVHMAPNPIFSSGDRFSVFHTELGKIGPVICADIQYPESVRCLAIDGAEIVVNSTAHPKREYLGLAYELLTQVNALSNQVWMVHSDQIGQADGRGLECYGHSRIVDPMGHVVIDTGYEEGLALAEVDLQGELMRCRGPEFAGRHLLQGRRPEAYHALCSNRQGRTPP